MSQGLPSFHNEPNGTFRSQLTPIDWDSPAAQCVSTLMEVKNIKREHALGMEQERPGDTNHLLFFFVVPGGVLEVLAVRTRGQWHRRINDFFSERDTVAEMLA